MKNWSFENVSFKHSVCLPQKTMEQLNQLDNPLDAMRRLNREHDQIPFLKANEKEFKANGKFELAVSEIYIMLLDPCRSWDVATWQDLFDRCDRERLLISPGQPFCAFPPTGFMIYRGCMESGLEAISWTLSREHAEAEVIKRYGGAEGEAKVYALQASLDDVAFFTNDRDGLEVVLYPGKSLFKKIKDKALPM